MNSPPERTESGAHVVDQVLEYHAGRIEPREAQEIEAHLAACATCAADYTWTLSLLDEVEANDLQHLASERLLTLAATDAVDPAPRELRHLELCAECRQALAWARALPSMQVEPTARIPGPARIAQAWAGALRRFGRLFLPDAESLVRLARIEPMPVRIQRGPVSPGSFEESWLRALERYDARDFDGAESELRRADERAVRRPEVSLYLGSVLLLLGRALEAIPVLREAVERAGPRDREAARIRVAEESRWQLANACLAAGDAHASAEQLAHLAAAGGARAGAAEELLRRLKGTSAG